MTIEQIIGHATSETYRGYSFAIEVFNDDEAEAVMAGLAKTGVRYNIKIIRSMHDAAYFDARRKALEIQP